MTHPYVCVCVYIYIYIYVHTCSYVIIYTYIYIYTFRILDDTTITIQPPKSDAKPQHSLCTVAEMWKINENDLTCFVAISDAHTKSLEKSPESMGELE